MPFWPEPEPELHTIGVIGPFGVGKTVLVRCLCWDVYCTDYDPYGEVDFRKKLNVDQQTCEIELLEFPGGISDSSSYYSTYREHMLNGSQAFMLCYSVTSRASFAQMLHYHGQAMQAKIQPQHPPIYLVGTKADDEGNREVAFAEAETLAGKLGCAIAEVSAKDGTNVVEVLSDVVRSIRNMRAPIAKPRRRWRGFFDRVFGRRRRSEVVALLRLPYRSLSTVEKTQ